MHQCSDLIQVTVDLRAGLVESVNRRSAELKLTTWLNGHALAIQHSPNDVFPLHDGIPSEARAQTL